jgi:hypothetical protein
VPAAHKPYLCVYKAPQQEFRHSITEVLDVTWSETAKLDRFWVEFFAPIPQLGGAKNDEGLKVFGRQKAFILKRGKGRDAGGGHLLAATSGQ